jgi:hypothetical protein
VIDLIKRHAESPSTVILKEHFNATATPNPFGFEYLIYCNKLLLI